MKCDLLFVQGGGANVHDDWDSHLVESLSSALGTNYEIRYPRMPGEGEPSYSTWKPALQRELTALDDGAILVGHSLGATVLVSLLAEPQSDREFGGIFLISAPFLGDGGWPSDDLEMPEDLGARLPSRVPVHFYYGLTDETVPPSHADLYARAVPQAQVHRLPDRDHQLNNDLREVAMAIESLPAVKE
jgi:predicted alpha/beta hydrolase family esterase